MSDEDRRIGARFITEFRAVLLASKGGAPIDDRATAHDVSAQGFKVETQVELAEKTIVAFTLELPMGGLVAGRGRVVWSTRETFSSWAGIEIVSMSWSDKRRLSKVLHPARVDWGRLTNLCVKLAMVLTVLVAAHRLILSAPLRGLLAELAPKAIALFAMGWALIGLLKNGKR